MGVRGGLQIRVRNIEPRSALVLPFRLLSGPSAVKDGSWKRKAEAVDLIGYCVSLRQVDLGQEEAQRKRLICSDPLGCRAKGMRDCTLCKLNRRDAQSGMRPCAWKPSVKLGIAFRFVETTVRLPKSAWTAHHRSRLLCNFDHRSERGSTVAASTQASASGLYLDASSQSE